MQNNPRASKGKTRLEPISIDELAGDSTMTGFSDLFKIPITGGNRSLGEEWKRPEDILSQGYFGDRLKEDKYPDHSEVARIETGPLVSASPVSTRSLLIDLDSAESRQTITDGPVTDRFNETHSPVITRGYPGTGFTEPSDFGGNQSALDADLPLTSPQTGGSVLVPVVSHGRVSDNPDTGRPVSTSDRTTKPLSIVDSRSIPALEFALARPLQRTLQIREVKLVQEGHTYGEQTVYEALWKNGNVVNDQVRVITIGFLRMATLAGLAESNCKAAVAGLIEKLAIEKLPNRNIAQGHHYRVYNWHSVLMRRRASGLTHVIKSRGVVFVDPQTGRKLTEAKTPPRHSRGVGSGIAETGGSVSVASREGLEPAAAHTPRSKTSASYSNPKTQAVAVKAPDENDSSIKELASRLRRDLDAAFDDSAAARLWRDCRRLVQDCTLDEVVYFVVLKSQKVYKDRNVRNPVGLLLMTIPEFFTGNAVQELRAQKIKEKQIQQELQEQQRRYWQCVADDTGTPADERDLALRFLAEME